MPIYEYYCPGNNRIYSFFARSVSLKDRIPRCPDDPKLEMKRIVSNFAVTGRAEEHEGGDEDALDDPRLERAMAELEHEFSGMDEENPDPRQMGRLMRRMSELTGERIPESMEEMVRRMEAGEDLEKLEEEFGDMPELDEFGMGEDEAGDGDGPLSASGAFQRMRKRARSRAPQRDPHLYELTDFI